MGKYFYVVTCPECEKIVIAREITDKEYNVYAAKGFHTCYEPLTGTADAVNVVYDNIQEICAKCVDDAFIEEDPYFNE